MTMLPVVSAVEDADVEEVPNVRAGLEAANAGRETETGQGRSAAPASRLFSMLKRSSLNQSCIHGERAGTYEVVEINQGKGRVLSSRLNPSKEGREQEKGCDKYKKRQFRKRVKSSDDFQGRSQVVGCLRQDHSLANFVTRQTESKRLGGSGRKRNAVQITAQANAPLRSILFQELHDSQCIGYLENITVNICITKFKVHRVHTNLPLVNQTMRERKAGSSVAGPM